MPQQSSDPDEQTGTALPEAHAGVTGPSTNDWWSQNSWQWQRPWAWQGQAWSSDWQKADWPKPANEEQKGPDHQRRAADWNDPWWWQNGWYGWSNQSQGGDWWTKGQDGQAASQPIAANSASTTEPENSSVERDGPEHPASLDDEEASAGAGSSSKRNPRTGKEFVLEYSGDTPMRSSTV